MHTFILISRSPSAIAVWLHAGITHSCLSHDPFFQPRTTRSTNHVCVRERNRNQRGLESESQWRNRKVRGERERMMWLMWRSLLFTEEKTSPTLHTFLYLLLLILSFPQLSSHFLSPNLPSPSSHFIASSFLTSSFLPLCPPFKVGLTLGVLNLQPYLCLPLRALTVNLSEKWRRWHITGMINSCWALIL